MNNLEKKLSERSFLGIFLLRVFIGLRLLYGVLDNIISWEKMIEFSNFLQENDFPVPMVSAVLSVIIQFLGSLAILVGYRIRLMSAFLVINFLVALIFVHFRLNDSVEGMTPALAMLFGCLTFLFTGAGKLSLDGYLEQKR